MMLHSCNVVYLYILLLKASRKVTPVDLRTVLCNTHEMPRPPGTELRLELPFVFGFPFYSREFMFASQPSQLKCVILGITAVLNDVPKDC